MAQQGFRIDNPYSGEIVAERRFLGAGEVEGTVARAARAQRTWARTPLTERIALCERFCKALEEDGERIAAEITQQMGKPLAQARGEVKTALFRARHMISIAPQALADEPLPAVPGYVRFVRHEPVGVVLDISAWNYPLLITVNVVVPAVLAGDAVLVKHAMRGEAFERAFAKAGAPEGLVTAVHADHQVCAQIVARPEIGFVSFTGSVRGGHEIYREVGKRFIDAGLELGGKDPAYVAPDADLEHAIANLVDGAFYNAGQSCCGIERIYVHRSLYDRFVEGALSEVRKLRMGDPMDASTTLGPLAQPGAPEKLEAQVEEARAKGGRVLCGGKATSARYDPALRALLLRDHPLTPFVRAQVVRELTRALDDAHYGIPFLATFSWWRGPNAGGGQWAADPSLYPFDHA